MLQKIIFLLLFSLVFILSPSVRFLLDLINQYYSLFSTKFTYMLRHSKSKQTDLTKCRSDDTNTGMLAKAKKQTKNKKL